MNTLAPRALFFHFSPIGVAAPHQVPFNWGFLWAILFWWCVASVLFGILWALVLAKWFFGPKEDD